MQVMNDDEEGQLDGAWTTILFMWVGLPLSLGIYIAIAIAMGDMGMGKPEGPADPYAVMGYVMYALVVVQLPAAYLIRKAVINGQVRSKLAVGFGLIKALLPQTATGRYLAAVMVSAAVIQCIGIYGLILYVTNADYFALYFMVGLAAIAQLYLRPRKQEFLDLADRLREEGQT